MAFPAASLTISVLGSGTSVGVPTIGCHCAVCSSTDPRDSRLRPSVLVGYGTRNIVIDVTPDFRQQALRARLDHLDAVVLTHAHADHIMGLDDVRPFNYRQRPAAAQIAEAPAVVQSHDVVGMRVREDDRVQPPDIFAQHLEAKFRRRVHDQFDLFRGHVDGGAGAVVFRVGQKFRRVLLADDRHALRSARAEEDE